jgi:hypothetical protein
MLTVRFPTKVAAQRWGVTFYRSYNRLDIPMYADYGPNDKRIEVPLGLETHARAVFPDADFVEMETLEQATAQRSALGVF